MSESESGAFSLSRLIYIISAAVLVNQVSGFVAVTYYGGLVRNHEVDKLISAIDYGNPAILLSLLLMLLAILWFYRPLRTTLSWAPSGEKERGWLLKSIGLGVGGGLIACLIASPLLLRPGGMLRFIASNILGAYFMSAASLFVLLMFAVALPVMYEVVFRGIVFRTLAEHASVPAAIIASSLLFAYFWPVLNWYAAVILSVVSAFLYYRTRNLAASMIANLVMTFCSLPVASAYQWLTR